MKKNEQGYYRVSFTYNGKRYTRKGTTMAEAHQKAAELKNDFKNGNIGISSNMTVAAWADEWLETYKAPVVGEQQYKDTRNLIKNKIVSQIGNKRIKDVKDIDLQKIMNFSSGQSKSSIDKLRVTIRGIFEKAYNTGIISKNPALNIETPQAIEGTHRSITQQERDAILAVAETHRAGLWIKISLYCGLRPGESRALEWRHIDFEKKLIHVDSAMKAGTRTIAGPKSKAGVRDIPIPELLLKDLSKVKAGPFEPVLARETVGLHHTKSSMRTMWDSFKRDVDIYMGAKLYRNGIALSVVSPDLVPYCLRHTYCTDLQDKGVPINIAKYLMGHSDIKMTSKIYTHITDKAIQDAATLINQIS